MTADAAAAPWSRLWDTGVLHSCATGIQGNYDGAILAFWQCQFDALEDHARIVDLGTGNGALLLLARDNARRRGIDFALHGIDIADINPVRTVADGSQRFAGIHFHPRTSACRLPFSDGGVDFVCSQFGFEYAPREATITEIARVIAHRGRLALVVHSDDSIVARVAVPQREGCAFLRDECPLVAHARELVPVLFEAGQARGSGGADPSPSAEAARLSFNHSAGALMDAIERLPEAQVLRNTAQQVRGALECAGRSPQQALRILDRLQDSLQDEDMRLRHLQDALLTADDLAALAGQLRGHGFDVRHAALEQRPGVKIGWWLEAQRG